MNRPPFAEDEWYHCYTRGIDKRRTFLDRSDFSRFLSLLYLCNSEPAIHRSNLRSSSLPELLSLDRKRPLVGIGAFCVMPNHFHVLVRETGEGGISAFMQKLGIAYTMYFNVRYERNGNLFAKPFKSRHIADDYYLQQVLQYIHLNPAEIFEPEWKMGRVKHLRRLEKKLLEYPYSSFNAFIDEDDPLRKILDAEIFELETQLSPKRMIQEARDYYSDVKMLS